MGVGRTKITVFLKCGMPWKVGAGHSGVCEKCLSNAGPPL